MAYMKRSVVAVIGPGVGVAVARDLARFGTMSGTLPEADARDLRVR